MDKITDNLLVHTSYKPIDRILSRNQKKYFEKTGGWKPYGLWYSPGKTWMDYSQTFMKKAYRYFYALTLMYTDLSHPHKNRVLQLTKNRDWDNFNFRYGYIDTNNWLCIRWDKVGADFGGIEIIPHLMERTHFGLESPKTRRVKKEYAKRGLEWVGRLFTWYDMFDVASGCVWNREAILGCVKL